MMAVKAVIDNAGLTPPYEVAGIGQNKHVAQAGSQFRGYWLRAKQTFRQNTLHRQYLAYACETLGKGSTNFCPAISAKVEKHVAR